MTTCGKTKNVNNSDASCHTGALITPLHRMGGDIKCTHKLGWEENKRVTHERRSKSCGLAVVPHGRQQVELDLFQVPGRR